MIRTLVQLMRTLNTVPEQRTIVMQLYYRTGTTPTDYEPPLFRPCTYEDTKFWARKPLVMKVGSLNSNHCEVSLKVRSILDPCEDDDDVHVTAEDKMMADLSSMDEIELYTSQGHDKSDSHLPQSDDLKTEARSFTVRKHVLADMTQDIQSMASSVAAFKEWAIQQPNRAFDDIDLLIQFAQIPTDHDLHQQNLAVANHEDVLHSEGRNLPASPVTINFPIIWDVPGCDEDETRLCDMVIFLIHETKGITIRELTQKMMKRDEAVNTALVNQLIQKIAKNGYLKITSNLSSGSYGHSVLHPLEGSEKELQEIVEGVKEFVITDSDADGQSDEDSLTNDSTIELRMKSRLDKFGDYSPCGEKLIPEPRIESTDDLLRIYLEEYHNGSEDKRYLVAEDGHKTKQEQKGDVVHKHEERGGLSVDDVQGNNPGPENKNLDRGDLDQEKVNPQGRGRKASRVEEPIYQHVYAKRKRA
ncbi:hypothetical protein R1sor_001173 [Riccia sorocarpa]|uniref:HORMA domain-containing protein n=1 Tax=Riccia sorocarpa TaxID=122646 RepID=A0ABD3GWV7_9MARC